MSVVKIRHILVLILLLVVCNISAETLEDIYKRLGKKNIDTLKALKTGYIEDAYGGKRFALYVPESYTAEKKWPLILGLHYSYGSGADYIVNWQLTAQRYGYMLLCPDSGDNIHWSRADGQRVMSLLNKIMNKYNVDEDRIYLTGFSAGAHFSYYMGLKYPNVFKAVVPVGGSIFRYYDRGDIKLSKSAGKHIPVYIIHGTKDRTVHIDEARRSRDLLLKYGYEVKYEEIKGHDHTHPHQINNSVIEWLNGINE